MNHTHLSGAQHSPPPAATPLGTPGRGELGQGHGAMGGRRGGGCGGGCRPGHGWVKTTGKTKVPVRVSPRRCPPHDRAERCPSRGTAGAHPLPSAGCTRANKRRQEMSKFKVLENPTFYLLHFCDYINAETL